MSRVSGRGRAISVVVLLVLGCALFVGKRAVFGPDGGIHASSGTQDGTGREEGSAEERETRKRERGEPSKKKVTEFSTDEMDRYLEARGGSEAAVLFVLLANGDEKYRELAMRLPDSPLKFMMLSMDVHNYPEMRLEWSRKLFELDPLNRVSASRYVSQLMEAGEKEKAAEVLGKAKDCDHASNGFDLLIGELEFARDRFGAERLGPRAVLMARTWSVRTAHYTASNYMDSLEYGGEPDKASTASIHDRAKDYLLDIGYSEDAAASQALLLTRCFLADFRDEYMDPADENLRACYTEEIKGIQAREEVLFHEGLEHYEKVVKHRSAVEDMDQVMEELSRWRARKSGK